MKCPVCILSSGRLREHKTSATSSSLTGRHTKHRDGSTGWDCKASFLLNIVANNECLGKRSKKRHVCSSHGVPFHLLAIGGDGFLDLWFTSRLSHLTGLRRHFFYERVLSLLVHFSFWPLQHPVSMSSTASFCTPWKNTSFCDFLILRLHNFHWGLLGSFSKKQWIVVLLATDSLDTW